ncbi:ChbG/HpnK family deacetylase [Tenacibaculum gallaicum]|uniref:ChbG/HpnK family deacetylase n=1 Tax=Tenacibaculum gallaicum TaxID=561505 RepID=UPI003743D0F1
MDSHEKSITTSTTMMQNMKNFDYVILKEKKYSKLWVGIHFTLTEGKPLISYE